MGSAPGMPVIGAAPTAAPQQALAGDSGQEDALPAVAHQGPQTAMPGEAEGLAERAAAAVEEVWAFGERLVEVLSDAALKTPGEVQQQVGTLRKCFRDETHPEAVSGSGDGLRHANRYQSHRQAAVQPASRCTAQPRSPSAGSAMLYAVCSSTLESLLCKSSIIERNQSIDELSAAAPASFKSGRRPLFQHHRREFSPWLQDSVKPAILSVTSMLSRASPLSIRYRGLRQVAVLIQDAEPAVARSRSAWARLQAISAAAATPHQARSHSS